MKNTNSCSCDVFCASGPMGCLVLRDFTNRNGSCAPTTFFMNLVFLRPSRVRVRQWKQPHAPFGAALLHRFFTNPRSNRGIPAFFNTKTRRTSSGSKCSYICSFSPKVALRTSVHRNFRPLLAMFPLRCPTLNPGEGRQRSEAGGRGRR